MMLCKHCSLRHRRPRSTLRSYCTEEARQNGKGELLQSCFWSRRRQHRRRRRRDGGGGREALLAIAFVCVGSLLSALPLERGGKGERQHSLCVPLPKSRDAVQAMRSAGKVISSLLAADRQEENFDATLLGDSETVDPLWRERETKELRVAIPNGRGTTDATSGRPADSHAAAEQTMADLIGILEVELRGSEDSFVSFPSSLSEL